MEGDAVNEGNEEERPVCATFGFYYVVAVVYGKEDVSGFGEVGESFA